MLEMDAMVKVAPHGKTVVLRLPYDKEEQSALIRLPPDKAAELAARLDEMVAKYGPPPPDDEPVSVEWGQEATSGLYVHGEREAVLQNRTPAMVVGDGTALTFVSLSHAANLSMVLRGRLAQWRGIRKRTRCAELSPRPTVRKRVRAHGGGKLQDG